MAAPLEKVLVRHASDAFRSQTFLDQRWREYGYTAVPEFSKACTDYDLFLDKLGSQGAQIEFLRGAESKSPDSIYVHDPAQTIGDGIVLCRMGKDNRRSESDRFDSFCTERNIHLLGSIAAPGLLEGGDIIWLDEKTLAVGEGYRSNREGIEQLQDLSQPWVDHAIRVPLPHWKGRNDVLHLMSLISPISNDTAVVYRPLLPVPFLNELADRDYALIDVPEEEFDSLGCNVLSLTPGCCLMADGNPLTRALIERAGIEVLVYPASEISMKGQGGPTCLTRPLVRSKE